LFALFIKISQFVFLYKKIPGKRNFLPEILLFGRIWIFSPHFFSQSAPHLYTTIRLLFMKSHYVKYNPGKSGAALPFSARRRRFKIFPQYVLGFRLHNGIPYKKNHPVFRESVGRFDRQPCC